MVKRKYSLENTEGAIQKMTNQEKRATKGTQNKQKHNTIYVWTPLYTHKHK